MWKTASIIVFGLLGNVWGQQPQPSNSASFPYTPDCPGDPSQYEHMPWCAEPLPQACANVMSMAAQLAPVPDAPGQSGWIISRAPASTVVGQVRGQIGPFATVRPRTFKAWPLPIPIYVESQYCTASNWFPDCRSGSTLKPVENLPLLVGRLKQAIQMWESTTFVRFQLVDTPPTDKPFVRIVYEPPRPLEENKPPVSGCFLIGSEGYDGETRQVALGISCSIASPSARLPERTIVGRMAHELGHVLGLIHEQRRWDREDYIRVDYSHLASQPEQWWRSDPSTFDLLFNWIQDTVIWPEIRTEYDFMSIMHYPVQGPNSGNAIAYTDKGAALLRATGDERCARRLHTTYYAQPFCISKHDQELINRLYGPAASESCRVKLGITR